MAKKPTYEELAQKVEQLEKETAKRKDAEEALRKKAVELDNILTNIGQGVAYMDENDSIMYLNKQCSDLFGLKHEDVFGKNIYEFHSPEKKEKIEKLVNEFRNGKQSLHLIETMDDRLVDNTFHRVENADGSYQGILMSAFDITERVRAEEALRKREADLEAQSIHLEESNIALKVLLEQRQKDKADLDENVISNVKQLVSPHIERLKKSRLDTDQTTLVSILESNLNYIVSPFISRLSSKFLHLTPMEIRVADLIKEGKTNKEIGELLYLSPNTVKFHRYNIRNKLGLKNTKMNLRSHLLSLTI